MPAKLVFVEADNFKSYKGHVEIGPLRPFVAVIGPNGSGKSNFMDAISFVMGERTSSLRVKRLEELIHGAQVGRPVGRTASVTATFELEGEEPGTQKKFARIIRGSASEYRINDNIVGQQRYLNELEELGINVKAKNFLVFQGAVETIALKTPKELTALIEEISGSGTLKDEYDRKKDEMLKSEEETQLTYLKKKGIVAERKEAQLEKKEADKYQNQKDEYDQLQIQQQLFKLYCTEQAIKTLSKDVDLKRSELEKCVKKKDARDAELGTKKNELKELNRVLSGNEKALNAKEKELNEKRPNFIQAKERVAHLKKKLESCKKSLDQALKAKDAHDKDIEELRKQYSEAEASENEYFERNAPESQSQSQNIALGDSQLRGYWEIKAKVQEKSVRYATPLTEETSAQKDDQDVLDSLSREKENFDNRSKQLSHEISESKKRVEKLSEHIRQNEAVLNEERRRRHELAAEVTTAKEKAEECQSLLNEINQKLGDARCNKHEEARRRKKQEVIDKLRSRFAGVHDRMINLCQPRHPKYKVAVTKKLGKYMEAIVVDTEKAAIDCVQYLKDEMLEPETFLPLDTIEAKPIKERLRSIQDPHGVSLLHDVLEYEPAIKNAILFCTNNALVCETPDDANRVAYNFLKPGERFDTISLDGTMFTKSGIMSGGTMDLTKKAQRWDEKNMAKLKEEKDKIIEKLREATKSSRMESELTAVEQRIEGLQTRQKFADKDRKAALKKVQELNLELEKVDKEFDRVNPLMRKFEAQMATRGEKIKKVKTKLNSIEDEHFKSFCQDINVANIRHYEERELRPQQEREQRRLEFQNKKDLVKSQIDLEVYRSESVTDNVTRWTDAVSGTENNLVEKQREEEGAKEVVDSLLHDFESMQGEIKEMKGKVNNKMEEVAKSRKVVGDVTKELQSVQKAIGQLEAKVDQKKSDKHNLLKDCKIRGIRIPLKRRNANAAETESSETDNAAADDGDAEDEDSFQLEVGSNLSSQTVYSREERLRIDYSKLPQEYKVQNLDEINRTNDFLNTKLQALQTHLAKIQAPNMNATQKLETVKEKLVETNQEFDGVRQRVKATRHAFETVKNERHQKFSECFDHVSNSIDKIYKSLTQNESAQATLGPENPEEPYLEGISYNCVAPGKRYQPMSNLSGGEKTIAALALLFAIHSYHPAPFFVLDEIDAALDNTNLGKVANYIRGQAGDLQIFVISLKEEFFSHADVLLGVCPDVEDGECMASKMYSLDLTEFAV